MDQISAVSEFAEYLEQIIRHEVTQPGESSFKGREEHHHHPQHVQRPGEPIIRHRHPNVPASPRAVESRLVDEDHERGQHCSHHRRRP